MNFALFMLAALALTGLVWALDGLLWRKRRAPEAAEPKWVEYSRSFFPIILVVFVIRSFWVEPFRIPSGSMMPTLLAGDFILVNKYAYGLRVPVLNNVFFEAGHPERGDIMVFRYPRDASMDYIKRVVGLPGDRIEYRGKRLVINGRPLATTPRGDYSYEGPGLNRIRAQRLEETLGTHRHDILLDHDVPAGDGFVVVPAGHYFVMGDNRDNSNDSRYWGFVPENNVVGRAFMIWWNFGNFGRIGTTIQ